MSEYNLYVYRVAQKESHYQIIKNRIKSYRAC